MKKLFFVVSMLVLLFAVGCNNGGSQKESPRIAIAGIAIESSTFSPAISHEDAFRARVGDDVWICGCDDVLM